MSKRVTHIYACGGGGITITADLTDFVGVNGFSDTRVSRLDTSEKNVTANMPLSSIFLLEDADGSGKQRDYNLKPVVASMDKILAVHQPADYNIVIFTAGGGSGSVLGPVLVGELLRRKAPVLALVIGSIGDETQAENSVNTLKSLAGIQSSTKRPVVFSYFEVNQQNSQADVDKQVRGTLMTLLNLLDSNNTIIDSKDIINFLDWTNVRKQIPAQLAALEVYIGDELNDIAGHSPISMATIYPDAERNHLAVVPAYSTDGIRGDVPANSPYADATVHYVVHATPVKPIFNELEKSWKRILDNQRANHVVGSILGDEDHADGSGMVV